MSTFWTPGRLSTCDARTISLTSYKKYFMQVDLPKNVYINESLTAKVSITSENITKEVKVCMCLKVNDIYI